MGDTRKRWKESAREKTKLGSDGGAAGW
eukprot:gene26473-biopygen16588